jgi:hypothetical protein
LHFLCLVSFIILASIPANVQRFLESLPHPIPVLSDKAMVRPYIVFVAEQPTTHRGNNESNNEIHRPQAANFMATDKRYNLAAHRRFRAAVADCNPMCQRVVDGKQCMHPSVICHHLISPKVDASKALSADNVVMVCRNHHPNTTGENPRDENHYVPTVMMLLGKRYEYRHAYTPPAKPLEPGEVRITANGVASIGR